PLPIITMVPYAQLRERNFAVHDGAEELISLEAKSYVPIDLGAVVPPGSEERITLAGGPTYDVSDDEFLSRAGGIIDNEVRDGQGANFLFSRKCRITIADFSARTANTIFQRLARNEFGAYMTFCFFDGERYFIGSSPERHVTVRGDCVQMNPI